MLALDKLNAYKSIKKIHKDYNHYWT